MHTIKNIHRGKGDRRNTVYAELHNDEGLEVGATLAYIIDTIKERKYKVELDGETLQTLFYTVGAAKQCGQ